ncbi:transporter substrate-binding domain-containing protein [Shewanella sp. VB17]|uniref:substrate-binding periplasmic protein n=1 Tax=Shewanella sp. VB17 TaxID=2739432 RepID=UPI0028154A5F|nr:transporter substrate-binding domain-containing protein [Shewanella sp. VB17]
MNIYADDSYPPYSYSEDGALKGIYIDILKKIFAKMNNYKITINPIAWKLGLSYMESGKGFALSPPYHRTKERPYIWPYSIPILDERIIVVCRAKVLSRTIRTIWPDDYYGLIIGLNSGFTLGGAKFWQAVKDKKITISEADGSEKSIMMLGNKKTDCYMNDRISTFWTLKQLKAAGQYDEGGKHEQLVEGTTISIEQGFLGFTAKGGDKYPYMDDFIMQFNKEIYIMRRSGELQKIIDDFIR